MTISLLVPNLLLNRAHTNKICRSCQKFWFEENSQPKFWISTKLHSQSILTTTKMEKQLTDMGFTEKQAKAAIRSGKRDLQSAVNWCLENSDDSISDTIEGN